MYIHTYGCISTLMFSPYNTTMTTQSRVLSTLIHHPRSNRTLHEHIHTHNSANDRRKSRKSHIPSIPVTTNRPRSALFTTAHFPDPLPPFTCVGPFLDPDLMILDMQSDSVYGGTVCTHVQEQDKTRQTAGIIRFIWLNT